MNDKITIKHIDPEKDFDPNRFGQPWLRKWITKEEAKEMFPYEPLARMEEVWE